MKHSAWCLADAACGSQRDGGEQGPGAQVSQRDEAAQEVPQRACGTQRYAHDLMIL